MPVLYEVIELANGDVALQREGDDKGQPLVTMRFSTELLRFLRNGKLDVAKIMIEAGLEEVAKLAADFTEVDNATKVDQATKAGQATKVSGKNFKRERVADEEKATAVVAQHSETQTPETRSLDARAPDTQQSSKKSAQTRKGSTLSATEKLHNLKALPTSRKEKISMRRRNVNSAEDALAELETVSHLIH